MPDCLSVQCRSLRPDLVGRGGGEAGRDWGADAAGGAECLCGEKFVADTGHPGASLCRGDAVYLAGLFVAGFVCDLPRDDPLAAQPHGTLTFSNHNFKGFTDVGAQA